MSDLVTRLRHCAEYYRNPDIDEAADEIERLHISCKHFEKDIKRLKEINYELQFGLGLRDEQIAKLQAIVDAAKKVVRDFDLMNMPKSCPELRKALAALEDDDD